MFLALLQGNCLSVAPYIRRRSDFATSASGSVAMLFALMIFVFAGVVGLAVDYARMEDLRGKMQSAADNAALAMVASDESKGQKKQVGKAYFNTALEARDLGIASEFEIESDGAAYVTAKSALPSTFAGLLGFNLLPVAVEARARKDSGEYLDVHAIVDVSGSMNVADGPAEMQKLKAAFQPYGGKPCAFACHNADNPGAVTGLYNGKTGYQFARENNVALREDRVKAELQNFFSTIQSVSAPGNVRGSLWTLAGPLTERVPLTSDFEELKLAAAVLPSTSDGTIWQWHLQDFASRLGAAGSGSKNAPRGVVVMITDGIDYQIGQDVPYGFDQTKCRHVKENGFELYVVHIKYADADLVTDGYHEKVEKLKPILPSVDKSLEACASPGRYLTADHGASIAEAFEKVVSSLTKEKPLRLVN